MLVTPGHALAVAPESNHRVLIDDSFFVVVDGPGTQTGDLTGSLIHTDEDGTVLGTYETSPALTDEVPADGDGFACSLTGSSGSVTAYQPKTMIDHVPTAYYLKYRIYPYKAIDARDVMVDGVLVSQDQFSVCAVGGMTVDGGWKDTANGATFSHSDPVPRIVDANGAEGVGEAQYLFDLGFNLSAGDKKVSASVSLAQFGRNDWAEGPDPMRATTADAHPHNQVWGHWDADCVPPVSWTRFCGSDYPERAGAIGLYEWPSGATMFDAESDLVMRLHVWGEIRCGRVAGVSCDVPLP